jgi:hypothetical protein
VPVWPEPRQLHAVNRVNQVGHIVPYEPMGAPGAARVAMCCSARQVTLLERTPAGN